MSRGNCRLENKNLWAPWRINYIQGLSKSSGCFICQVKESPKDDDKNFVLWRSAKSIIILNRFPYNNGHLLISPLRHIPDLETTSDEELLELIKLVRECQKALSLAIEPHGFNIGMNIGGAAGAGIKEHAHLHVVPRWNGDANYMGVIGNTKVVSYDIYHVYEKMKKGFSE